MIINLLLKKERIVHLKSQRAIFVQSLHSAIFHHCMKKKMEKSLWSIKGSTFKSCLQLILLSSEDPRRAFNHTSVLHCVILIQVVSSLAEIRKKRIKRVYNTKW